jgi:hypothetical protein
MRIGRPRREVSPYSIENGLGKHQTEEAEGRRAVQDERRPIMTRLAARDRSFTRREALGRVARGIVASALPALPTLARAVAPTSPDDPAEERRDRIFVASFRNPALRAGGAGILAIHPDTGAWAAVCREQHPFARVSPDGRWMASARQGMNAPSGVWLFDLRGEEEPRRLLDGDGLASWSNDGKQVLVSRSKSMTRGDEEAGTWRVSRDGSGKTKLPIPESELILDWSPDGRWVLASSERDRPVRFNTARFHWPVFAMRLDGTERRLLIEGEKEDESTSHQRFSPDAREIVYSLSTRVGENRDRLSVWIVDRDGKQRRQLQREGVLFWEAAWSPDGRRLVAKVSTTERIFLEVVDPEGKRIPTPPRWVLFRELPHPGLAVRSGCENLRSRPGHPAAPRSAGLGRGGPGVRPLESWRTGPGRGRRAGDLATGPHSGNRQR